MPTLENFQRLVFFFEFVIYSNRTVPCCVLGAVFNERNTRNSIDSTELMGIYQRFLLSLPSFAIPL